MVVVSGSWVKNVQNSIPTITDMVMNNIEQDCNNMTATGTAPGVAKALLIKHPNSHPFQARTLALDQPVKVGRSVARAKATNTNAIFDCKVLSRHHALLWYENGKFFLQDTKSSNGTFVNNNRLTPETEDYEVSSGDIVQFGVDVVENNRKVTHGCIIANLKLFLPDGKEAKAVRNGVAPLDELYQLNQILQEATQREQCLETKLTALQHLVDEAKKSANESWQIYVGEERLLSRISVLENQLSQASQKLGEDRYREELSKLQEEKSSYQIATKETLEKLHAERLEAISNATEQERARISAQQEILLLKEQQIQTQRELEEIAQKLMEAQKKAEEDKALLQEREKEIQNSKDSLLMQCLLGDYISKSEVIGENENETVVNGVEPQQNHINLTVAPVKEENISNLDDSMAMEDKDESDETTDWYFSNSPTNISVCENAKENENDQKEEIKHVTFKLSAEEEEDRENENSQEKEKPELDLKDSENNKHHDDSEDSEQIDSKTLKNQFQSVQNELKKKIEVLEIIAGTNKTKIRELEKELNEEKDISSKRLEQIENLRDELQLLQQKLKDSLNEREQLKSKVCSLSHEVELNVELVKEKELRSKELSEKLRSSLDEQKKLQKLISESNLGAEKEDQVKEKDTISNSVISYEQLVSLEQELVLLKERFAQINEEKLQLQKDLEKSRDDCRAALNESANKLFVMILPIIAIFIYLFFKFMVS